MREGGRQEGREEICERKGQRLQKKRESISGGKRKAGNGTGRTRTHHVTGKKCIRTSNGAMPESTTSGTSTSTPSLPSSPRASFRSRKDWARCVASIAPNEWPKRRRGLALLEAEGGGEEEEGGR